MRKANEKERENVDLYYAPGILFATIYLLLMLNTILFNYSLQLFVPVFTSTSIFLILLITTNYLVRPNIQNTLGFSIFTIGLLGSYFEKISTNIVLVFFILGILVLLWDLKQIKPTQIIYVTAPSFNNIRNNITNIIDQLDSIASNDSQNHLTDTVSNLKNLKLDLEDYGAESWQKEREKDESYHRITNNLFYLCDLLENRIASEQKTDSDLWFHSNLLQIIKDEGIKEIQVKKGDFFNGKYHKSVDVVFNNAPKETILELIRKGYYI
jgi:molecular chaperone GrpE (heat shock protein)